MPARSPGQTALAYVFAGLLALQALLHLNFGYQMLLAPEQFAAMSGVPFQDPALSTEFVYRWVGMTQGMVVAGAVIGMWGALRGRRSGVLIGVVTGGFFLLIAAGILHLALTAGWPLMGAVIDGGRGLLTVALGLAVFRSLPD